MNTENSTNIFILNMKTEPFKYVEVATGSVCKRNIISEYSTLSMSSEQEQFCSMWNFDKKIIEYIEMHNGVAGYKGRHVPRGIIIDFDSEKLENVKKEVVEFCERLEIEYDLTGYDYTIYFSGNKGFHVNIPIERVLKDIEAKENYHTIIKLMVHELTRECKYVDRKIYDLTRLIRMPNTRHSKSGLYKIPLLLDELKMLTSEEIKNRARINCYLDDEYECYSRIVPNKKLNMLFNECAEKIENNPKGGNELREVKNEENRPVELHTNYMNSDNSEIQELEKAVQCIHGKLQSYNEWINCAFALSEYIYENKINYSLAEGYFIAISTNNPKYTDTKAEIVEVFSECHKRNKDYAGEKIKIGTLFKIASKYGYKYHKIHLQQSVNKIANTEIYDLKIEKAPKQENEDNADIRFEIGGLSETVFKKLIQQYDSDSSSPTEFILTSTLAGLSGAIGKNAYFQITEGFRIYLNIWALILGPSTFTRKTTAINKTTAELEKLSKELFKKHQADLKKFINDEKNAKENGLEFNESLPIRQFLILPQDASIEGLSSILCQARRGLIKHSEFGDFLAKMDKSYNKDAKTFFTSIYDVPESYEITRADPSKNRLMYFPYVSIIAASTIEWVIANSRDTDRSSGFFARFLYSIRNYNDKEIIPLLELKNRRGNRRSEVDIVSVFKNLIDIPEDSSINVSHDAEKIFTGWEIENHTSLKKLGNNDEISFKERLLIYTLKIAGIVALVDNNMEVQKNHMCDAIKITEYFMQNVDKFLYVELNKKINNKKEEHLLSLLRHNGGELLHSKLYRKTSLKANEFAEIMQGLIEKELIEIEVREHPYNKNPIKKYKLK